MTCLDFQINIRLESDISERICYLAKDRKMNGQGTVGVIDASLKMR